MTWSNTFVLRTWTTLTRNMMPLRSMMTMRRKRLPRSRRLQTTTARSTQAGLHRISSSGRAEHGHEIRLWTQGTMTGDVSSVPAGQAQVWNSRNLDLTQGLTTAVLVTQCLEVCRALCAVPAGSGARLSRARAWTEAFGSTIIADLSLSTDVTWSGVPIEHQVPSQEAEQRQLQHRETLSAEALGNRAEHHSNDSKPRQMYTWTPRWTELTDSTRRADAKYQRSDGRISFSPWMTW